MHKYYGELEQEVERLKSDIAQYKECLEHTLDKNRELQKKVRELKETIKIMKEITIYRGEW